MKAKKLLPILLSATAFTVGLSGCSDFDNDYTAGKIAYDQNFKDFYGDVSADQTWNMASANTITVNSTATGNVDIFAKNGTDYQLVASYKNVQPGAILGFDALAGTTQVLVSDGISAQKVNVGESVNLAQSSRAIMTGTTKGITIGKTANGDYGCDSEGYRYFTETEIKAYTTVAPEGENNTNKVTCNFQMVSNGTFTIYPLYWQTSSWSNIGVYYKDANGEVQTVDIYKGKEGDDFQYYSNDADGNNIPGDKGWVSFTHAHIVSALNFAIEDDNNYKLRSQGIKITIPEGTVFGMYIDVQSNVQTELESNAKWKSYSDKELNSSAYRSSTIGASNYINSQCIDKSLAAFYTVNGSTYISFEDWNPDNDLNDMVFFLDGDLPTAIDKTATEWLIACEDRSEIKGDNDFNDVVFKVSHGTDNTYVNVTPLAAAGTYASYLYYGDPESTGQNLGEIHELIDPAAQQVDGLYTQINGGSIAREGAIIHVPVASTFSLDQYLPATDQTSNQKKTNYESFYIQSVRQDGTGTENARIVFPERGDVPAMFCVPASWSIGGVKYIWPWPQESVGISSAYPQFAAWVSDPTSNKEWYQTYNSSKVVVGSYSISTTTTTDAEGSLNNLKPLKASPSSLSLEVGENKTITLTSGSDGSYTLFSGSSEYMDVTLNGNEITVQGKSEGSGIINVTQAASSNGKYQQQTLDIHVTISAAKTPSEFAVTPSSPLSLETNGSAKTITITSKNSTTPTVNAVSGSNFTTISSVSGGTYEGGVYSWTFTVAPKTEVGTTKIEVIQQATAEMAGGNADITINVEAANYGKIIKHTYNSNQSWGYESALSDITSQIGTPTDDTELLFTYEIEGSAWGAQLKGGNQGEWSYNWSNNGLGTTQFLLTQGPSLAQVTVRYGDIKDYNCVSFCITAYSGSTSVNNAYVKIK